MHREVVPNVTKAWGGGRKKREAKIDAMHREAGMDMYD
jgi:hypothetical protein